MESLIDKVETLAMEIYVEKRMHHIFTRTNTNITFVGLLDL